MSTSAFGSRERCAIRPSGSALRAAVSCAVQALESRLMFNAPPVAPVVLEPLTDGKVVFGSDVHMEIGDFADPDAGDARLNTDWEIWTSGATPQRVWFALAKTGPFDDHHIHLGDGTFAGPLAGRAALPGAADYQLRVRTRDNSGDAATNTSAWSVRAFHTLADEQPTAAGWVAQQPGYKVEELPFTFPAGEQPFRLPTNIAFVPDSVHGHHPDDPLFYVMELYGSIRVVSNNFTVRTYATGLLNYNPSGPISGAGENGSAGIVVDPTNGDVYATMLYDDLADGTADTFPKITRFTSTNGGLTGVGTDLLKMPGEPMRQSHFISNISFGPADGKLYVHIGDGFVASTAKNLNLFRGKIVRLNRDGSPVADNPFYDPVDRGADGLPDAEDYVWAYGYRNPFGGAWRDADGSHYVVENGPSRDRFSKMVRGRNYLFDGTDASMNNFNIAYSADASGTFENGAPDWNPAIAPVNVAFVQQSTGNYSHFPVEKWDHAFVAVSGPTHAAGPNAGKAIQEWVLNPDGTRRVSAAGEAPNPRELVSYEGAGYESIAGLASGPDGLYFTTLYPDTNANPSAVGVRVLRVVYTGTTGPVNWYKLDEPSGTAAADGGSAPNAGTLVNGPVRVAGVVGAGAVQFDGVNDYVATATDLAPRLGGTATLTAWLKTTQVGNVKMYKSPGIAGVEQAGLDNDVFWGWIDDAGRIGVMAGDTAGAKSARPVNDGQWHLVALTRDAASGRVQVYVDGALGGEAVSATGAKTTPFASLGRIEDTSGAIDYFAGSLDDVRVYDRVLSAAEIAALMPGGANAAPTVATPAAAAQDSPTTVKVSVLGADDAGEAGLTYAWTVLSKPAGAADPTFSLNGTNGAKSSTATLLAAGAYAFRVTITDGRGLSVASDVGVTVAAVLTGVTVSPQGVTVANGGTQQFAAVARDQFNIPLATQPAFTWSLGAGGIGTLSAAGLYTAPATGTGSAAVTATAGGRSGSAGVTVTSSSTPDVTGGLVRNYRLDNNGGTTATDSAGTNNATLTNGPVWSAGKIGASAVTLDGVNDYLATSNLAGTLGGTATLTAWLKTTQVGNVKMYNAPGIVGVEQYNGANDIFWGWLDETGRIAFKVGDNTNVARSTSPVNDGQWHHVAFTRDSATGVIKLYVDGVLNATATSDTGTKSTPFASFGRIEDTGGAINYLAGSLDEIRVYDRVLSDAEVMTVKNAGGTPPPPTGATVYASDLPYQAISNGYGPVEKDTSNGEKPAGDGRTITVGGVTYAKGFGTHASSEILVSLNGQYVTFLADVGVDDEVGNAGSVVFQIFLDDIKVYDSGVMTGASATKSVSIDVTGRSKMQLVVTDAGDGMDNDHADWANARLVSSSSSAAAASSSVATMNAVTVPLAVAPTTKTIATKKPAPTPVTQVSVGVTKSKMAKPAGRKK
jgi:glucose/arabinose dehydrogenase